MAARVIRGRILTFTAEPVGPGDTAAYDYREDGAILLRDGRIVAVGPATEILATAPGVPVDHHETGLILPGLIDTHIHFPQTQVIASYGTQLLDWLERYTFIEEQRYADPAHAARQARFFVDTLLRHGTTTALVYGSVHPSAMDAFFAEAERRNLAMIAGKSMMDRSAPVALCDTAQGCYDEVRDLIGRWHGRGRLRYAVTPRFAITSTPAQLELAGALVHENPGVLMQTHLSENLAEIDAVRALYPDARDYTDVYDRFGLLGPRSLFGHCIHLSDAEVARLAESGSVAVFCPTSNLFIGSGLFDQARLRAAGVRVALGTDVGGGTSYSMLATASDGYKVLQLQGQNWPALSALHQMTRGNARALGLGAEIGSIGPGYWGDLVVLDAAATPVMAHRLERAQTLEDELFLLMMLGDDRAVRATYVAGERVTFE